MSKVKEKKERKDQRAKRIRAKIFGNDGRPRLSVFKSNKGEYLQLINDDKGITLVSAYSKEIGSKGKKMEISYELGKLIAKKAIEKKIENIVFDKGGNKYHGRVEAIARGARDGGLKF